MMFYIKAYIEYRTTFSHNLFTVRVVHTSNLFTLCYKNFLIFPFGYDHPIVKIDQAPPLLSGLIDGPDRHFMRIGIETAKRKRRIEGRRKKTIRIYANRLFSRRVFRVYLPPPSPRVLCTRLNYFSDCFFHHKYLNI